MVVNGRPLKKARTRAEARDFAGFPAARDGGAAGTFREAVRGFLARHARLLPLPSIFSPAAAAAPPHLLTWRVSLRVGEDGDDDGAGGCGVELNVVEEDVLRSRSVYCDQCRVVGELLSFFFFCFFCLSSKHCFPSKHSFFSKHCFPLIFLKSEIMCFVLLIHCLLISIFLFLSVCKFFESD
jgi:hypothetical protein